MNEKEQKEISEIGRQLENLSRRIDRLIGGTPESSNSVAPNPASCNHAWDKGWRDATTGRVYRNCAICGVRIEV